MKYRILLAAIVGLLVASCNDEGKETGILTKNVREVYFYKGTDSTNYSKQLEQISYYNSIADSVYFRYNEIEIETKAQTALTQAQYNNKCNSYLSDSMKKWSEAVTYAYQILDNGTYAAIAPTNELYEKYHVPVTVR